MTRWGLGLAALMCLTPPGSRAQGGVGDGGGGARVTGHVTILEKGKKPSPDLGDAVIFVEGPGREAGCEPGIRNVRVAVQLTRVTTRMPGGGGGMGTVDLQITLNARGYKWEPHKNKYGQDYPTNAGLERY